jgi:outer membrane protein OmpU
MVISFCLLLIITKIKGVINMNIKKIGLTALGTSLIASSAIAGTMDVTGSASLTFAGQNNYDTGNGFTMSDAITFTGGGEMDNGWNVTVSMELDDNAGNNLDDRSLTIDMGDMGTLKYSGHGGSTAASAIDDMTPTAYGESWDVLSGTTTRTGGSTARVNAIGGYGDDNIFMYTAPDSIDGLAVNVSYVPSHTDRTDSSVSFSVQYTGVDGLAVGYAVDSNGKTGTTETTEEIENELMYVTYAYDAFTVGYQSNEADGATSNNDDEMTAYGVTYAISDDLSVGYNYSEINLGDATVDQESTNYSFSYTMGSMTIAGALVTMDNVGGSTSARDDIEGYELNASFAF